MELFRKDALYIERSPQSWQDAIRITGKLLLDAGSIEESYIQAMIDAVNELGPYIVIAPGIALAHAAASVGVLKNDMVLLVFKEPVLFNCDNDPVHLMIGLCAIALGSHRDHLKNLSALLDDEEVINGFLSCEDIDQLYALVNNNK
jgi:PTS system ascorbate-specific IIA component